MLELFSSCLRQLYEMGKKIYKQTFWYFQYLHSKSISY